MVCSFREGDGHLVVRRAELIHQDVAERWIGASPGPTPTSRARRRSDRSKIDLSLEDLRRERMERGGDRDFRLRAERMRSSASSTPAPAITITAKITRRPSGSRYSIHARSTVSTASRFSTSEPAVAPARFSPLARHTGSIAAPATAIAMIRGMSRRAMLLRSACRARASATRRSRHPHTRGTRSSADRRAAGPGDRGRREPECDRGSDG